MIEKYVCAVDKPFLLVIKDGGSGLTLKLVWDALTIKYVNADSMDYVEIRTPLLNLMIKDGRVINHVLEQVTKAFLSGRCFEAENEVIEVG